MAQIAQKRLYFKIGASSTSENDATDVYLDIAAALTAVNRKQYHQFSASGEPLCYTVTISDIRTAKGLHLCTAPNTWTTRNASKKTAVGWKAQLKHSGIRLSELPTYARRFRCAYDSGAISGLTGQSLTSHLVPDGCDGTRLFTPYDAPDGDAVNYFATNEVVLLPVKGEAGPDMRSCLLGATAANDFGMIHEYLKSRRNMREETDMSTEFPDADGFMNTLYAVSEEMADDVVDAVDDYNISRPYTEVNASEAMTGAITVASTPNFQATFSAPLGLIKFTAPAGQSSALNEDDEFIIDVEAVYEM